MQIVRFPASTFFMVNTTILALVSILTLASSIHIPGLLSNSDTAPNLFLDLSTWTSRSPVLDRDPSSWVIQSLPSEDTSTAALVILDKRHDYVMVCANEQQHDHCQRSPRDYYCNKNGYVVQRKTTTVNYMPCDDQCVCLGAATKPICHVGWKGSSTCLRNFIEFVDSKPHHTVDPRDVAENEDIRGNSMSELTNRAAEPETALTFGLDQSSDNTPEAEHNSTLDQNALDTNPSLDPPSSNPVSITSRQGKGAADGWFMFCFDREHTVLCGDKGAYQCDSSGKFISYLPDAPKYKFCEEQCICMNLQPKSMIHRIGYGSGDSKACYI